VPSNVDRPADAPTEQRANGGRGASDEANGPMEGFSSIFSGSLRDRTCPTVSNRSAVRTANRENDT
jgi:hypothetical protein